MTFGQQPQGNNGPGNGFNNNPYRYNAQQPYGQFQQAGQYGYATAAPVIDAQTAYAYEKAQRISVTKTYGEMTLGLLLTAVVAIATQVSGLYITFLQATGILGVWGLAIVQIVLAVMLSARIHKISVGTARLMFYVYAALMGVTLSTIFIAYDLGTVGIALALCAGFFFALTMFGMTTKIDMLKAGPILMIGLIVLIIAQVILMIFFPGDTSLMMISALGLILFAGMTIHDAQFTRAAFQQYASAGPDMIKKVSIICALNLYLDFVNMFLYLLQLLGNRE